MATGKHNFTTQGGVQYIIDRYLDGRDKDELKQYNTSYTKDKFTEKLISKIERGSGSSNWIPSNYKDELVENASAIIGTNRRSGTLKNKRNVDIYTTPSGKDVYEDRKGKLREYKSGRFTKKTVFED